MFITPISSPSDISNPVSVADWVEFSIFISNLDYIGKAEIRREIITASGLDEEEADVQTELLIQEIQRRHNLAPLGYPFSVVGTGINLNKALYSVPYFFMLLISISPNLRLEKRQSEVEKSFDYLIVDSLIKMLGNGSRGLRFGSPASDHRPKSFIPAINWLAKELNLKTGTGLSFKPRRKDGGVDVVVWRPFNDHRSAFVTILAQCTVQIDWKEKAKDIVEDLWRGWVDFGKNPITCLAIPFVVSPGYSNWDEVRRTTVLILDRMRVVELLNGDRVKSPDEMDRWMKKELMILKKQLSKKNSTKLSGRY